MSDVDEFGMDAFEEAISSYTVGIAHTFEGSVKAGIATGTALLWNGHHLILTAGHVVAETAVPDFGFFFRPPGSLIKGHPDDTVAVMNASYRPVQELAIERVAKSSDADIAAVKVKPPSGTTLRFFTPDPDSAAPATDTTVLLRGHPRDLTRPGPGKGVYATFASHEWTTTSERRPSGHVVKDSEFFVNYTSAEEYLPHGFSGCGVWVQKKKEWVVWHANPQMAGVATGYFRQSKLIAATKIEVVHAFLELTFPAR